MTTWLAATLVVAALLAVPASPAAADSGGKGNPEVSATCTTSRCRARIRVPGQQQHQSPGRPGNPGSGAGTGGTGDGGESDPPPLIAGGQAGCPNGGEYIGSMMYCYPADPPPADAAAPQTVARPPQVWFDQLIASAYSAVVVPELEATSAPSGEGDTPLITQLPTWLWVEPAEWVPATLATPQVLGFWVELTATPSVVTFSSGEDSVSCGDNEGPAYTGGSGSSDCTLTFTHSSATGPASITTEVSWTVDYACLPDCGTGTLPNLTTTSQRDVDVAELQAVGVGR